jgi:dihydrofolate synthase/folylpolyglutamate synthase
VADEAYGDGKDGESRLKRPVSEPMPGQQPPSHTIGVEQWVVRGSDLEHAESAMRRRERRRLDEWLTYIGRIHPKSVSMGLERIAVVRQDMGLMPKFPVITVTGTNGKGSTCAMLEEMLALGGYRVGCYTSPHLTTFLERVRVNRQFVSSRTLLEAFCAVDGARDGVPLTYFEFSTLAAMRVFIGADVDVCVLEVGLGGRLDAVNVFDADCSIVTSIALDHVEYLGNTREDIAFEKAGIFRPGRPAICGEPDVPDSMLDYARDHDVRLFRIGQDFDFTSSRDSWTYRNKTVDLVLPPPALRGVFQLRNASAAITALDAMKRLGLSVCSDAVASAVRQVTLPGRFQLLGGAPLVIADVAHNPAAAQSLAENLHRQRCEGRTSAVLGMLKDKDIDGVIRGMCSGIETWYVCDLDTERGASAQRLVEGLRAADVSARAIKTFRGPRAAYEAALRDARSIDRIVVFGSFHTVSPILTLQDLPPTLR